MDATTLGAIAAIIAALTGLLGAIQNMLVSRQVNRVADRNAAISQTNTAAISAVSDKVTEVDVKVAAVAEQTNGHMTTLIAAATADKSVEAAGILAEKLKSEK